MFEDVKDMEVSSENSREVAMSDHGSVNIKPKFHLLKKLFMPWKWKRKKKSEKFKAISKTLERKISVRISKDQLVEMGLIPATGHDQVPVVSEQSCEDNPCYDGTEENNVGDEFPTLNDKKYDSEDEFSPVPFNEESWVSEVGVIPPPPMFSPLVTMRVSAPDPGLKPQLSVSSAGEGLDLSDPLLAESYAQIQLVGQDVKSGDCLEAVNPMIDKLNSSKLNSSAKLDNSALEFRSKIASMGTPAMTCRDSRAVPTPAIARNDGHSSSDMSANDISDENLDPVQEDDTRVVTDQVTRKQSISRRESLSLKLSQRPPLKELLDKNLIHQIGQEEWQERRDRIGKRLERRLSTRPSAEELRERNLIPKITNVEKEDLKRRISIKLERRLSIRPTETDLTDRNILRFETEQQARQKQEETKVILQRKLSIRPSVAELRKRKILHFSEFIDVVNCQEYDRSADKPWTRLTTRDKASIRKELNDFKSLEMEVHEDSRHLTRFHKP